MSCQGRSRWVLSLDVDRLSELYALLGRVPHFVYFDRPQQFADVVTRFFERHGPASAAEQPAPR